MVVRGRGVVRRGGGSVAGARGAVDVAPVVAGADVLVEDGVLPALEGVLLAVMVAEVVNLNTVDQQILKVSTRTLLSISTEGHHTYDPTNRGG